MLDYIARSFALFGQAIPAFWLGIVLILIFAVYLGWFPTSTRGDGSWDFKHIILPAVTLGWGAMASYVRLTRTAMQFDHFLARMRRSRETLGLPADAPGRGAALFHFLRGFLPPVRSEVFRFDDPRPFFRESLSWIRSGTGQSRGGP